MTGKSNLRYIFLSPHMDDVVFSAGLFLLELKRNHTPVKVITVFTGFGTYPVSWDSMKYILRSGFFLLSSFSNARLHEEFHVMKTLGVPTSLMGFIDGGFRKNEVNKIIYPNSQSIMSGVISPYDASLIQEIKKRLRLMIKPTDILVAPLGIGNHVDHKIVHDIVSGFSNKTLYWLDQPYADTLQVIPSHISGYKIIKQIKSSKSKGDIIRLYRSQHFQHFPPHCTSFPEEVIFKKLLLK